MSYNDNPSITNNLEINEYSFDWAGLKFSIRYSGSSKISDVKNLSYMGQPLTTFTEIAVLHSYIISLLRDRSVEGSFFIAGENFAFTTIEKTVGKTKGRERREKALGVTLYGEANIINYQEAVLLDIGLQKLRQVFKI